MQRVSYKGLLMSHCWLTLNLAGVLLCQHMMAGAARRYVT